jgi:allophanate hydrolase subunit 2
VVTPGPQGVAPADAEEPVLDGPVRLFGTLRGTWHVGGRVDRMGYGLDGPSATGGAASEWSEPTLPGHVQLPPGGAPIVLMAEGPTVGGYAVAAVVHSEDLRIVAQTRTGRELRFVPA